ncbi:MAG: Rdx family protein [Phycisphaerae bacterium]|nr:Rdx family protein [Phycisphaerae bacterium]
MIKDEIGVEPELIRGSGGVFDVAADGRLIYSKQQTGRFPEPYEVINQLKPKR